MKHNHTVHEEQGEGGLRDHFEHLEDQLQALHAKPHITHEVHPYGVITFIPLEDLIVHYSIASGDNFEDLEPDETPLSYLTGDISETLEPLRSFGITLYPILGSDPTHISIHTQFTGGTPPNHLSRTIKNLKKFMEIVDNASTLLDTYTNGDHYDNPIARQSLIKESINSNYEATIYFIRFQQFEGDDTAFDYHSGYTSIILETLLEVLKASLED